VSLPLLDFGSLLYGRDSFIDSHENAVGKTRIVSFNSGNLTLYISVDDEEGVAVSIPFLAQMENVILCLEDRCRAFLGPSGFSHQFDQHADPEVAQHEFMQLGDRRIAQFFILLFCRQRLSGGFPKLFPGMPDSSCSSRFMRLFLSSRSRKCAQIASLLS